MEGYDKYFNRFMEKLLNDKNKNIPGKKKNSGSETE